ncbi:MAG: UDP-2,3-diacylglucosamine diphosphatase [Bacteroidales bacterium]|nr:UDP-2,3-diacylglucosamine diphosphatase [Bacteroidales bacterium]
MPERNHIYFVSDLHLGMETGPEEREREKIFVEWLNTVLCDARAIWFLGDVFDYWFEYRHVVPRGFTRFLGKLAEMADDGIEIHFFTGNHDIWIFDYLPEEIGLTVHREPIVTEFSGKRFFLGHGDGYSPKDLGYLLIKWLFRSRFLQWLYARIHPNAATAFARWSSRKSRNSRVMPSYLGTEKEDIIRFAKDHAKTNPEISYYIFGHRHLAFDVAINDRSRVLCLGDWIVNFTYARFDGKKLELKKFFRDRGEIISDRV